MTASLGPATITLAVEDEIHLAEHIAECVEDPECIGSKRKSGGVIELPYLDGKQWAQFPEAR